MELGSKFVYLGNTAEDVEEVTECNGVVLSDSESEDSESEDSVDDAEECLLDILDTAGQEEYSSLRDLYVRTGDGFVIIYSIIDRNSFNQAESIFKWLLRIKKINIFAILVANKQDVASEATVTSQEGQDLAQTLAIPFFETSAKTGQGITEAMTGLIKTIPRTSKNYKIVMLGSGAVGKSCITLRFVSNTFLDDYDPTIEDSYRKMIKVQGLQKIGKFTPQKRSVPPKLQMALVEPEPKLQQGFYQQVLVEQKLQQALVNKTDKPGLVGRLTSSFENFMNRPRLSPTKSYPERPLSFMRDIERPQARPEASGTKIKEKKTDANVVLIPLRILADEPNLVTGDPITCAQCLAVLTSTAVLKTEGEAKKWECEFCSHCNSGLDISENEVPKEDSIDYMLIPAPIQTDKEDTAEEVVVEKKKVMTTGVTVYCMDISGSMQSLCHVPESHVAWREERTHGSETVSQVSRLDCIKKAIQRQIEQLKEENPAKQVLLVVFDTDVFVKSGGTTHVLPVFNQIDRKTFEELLQLGVDLSRNYPLKSIEESFQSVSSAVTNLRPGSSTALGPALSICAGYVSNVPGSEIVLCTDGEPNVGIGSHTSGGSGDAFYRTIGDYARSKNITINILAVGEDSVQLRTVSEAAERSGGLTNRLNPVEMMRQLRLIAQNLVIATSVSVRFSLHPNFFFDEIGYPDNLSKLEKEVGNVRKETELTFRYKPNDSKKSEIEQMSSVPFQIQITYTRPDGMRCLKVLSKAAPTTTSRKEMEENVDVSVMGAAAMKATAYMTKVGKSREAQHLLKNVKRLVTRGALTEPQQQERLAFENQMSSWDNFLTGEQHRLVNCAQLDDTAYNALQVASNVTANSHYACDRKMTQIKSKVASRKTKDAYYSYQDNY